MGSERGPECGGGEAPASEAQPVSKSRDTLEATVAVPSIGAFERP